MVGDDQTQRRTLAAVIPQHQVRLVQEPLSIPVRQDAGCAPPQVQLIQHNGQLQAIDILCSCGERIRLRCVYS